MAVIKQNSGGTLDIVSEQTGKGVLRLGGPVPVAGGSDVAFQGSSYLKVTLGTTPGTGGVITTLNPFGEDVIVGRSFVNITAASGAAATASLDIGVGSTALTGGINLLFSALTVGSTGVFDNITEKGSSGSTRQLWSSGTYLIGTALTTPNTLAGAAYFEILRP